MSISRRNSAVENPTVPLCKEVAGDFNSVRQGLIISPGELYSRVITVDKAPSGERALIARGGHYSSFLSVVVGHPQ